MRSYYSSRGKTAMSSRRQSATVLVQRKASKGKAAQKPTNGPVKPFVHVRRSLEESHAQPLTEGAISNLHHRGQPLVDDDDDGADERESSILEQSAGGIPCVLGMLTQCRCH